ncbi:NAD-dependent epimerase/dehydratase family protein [Agrobacterium sp. AGB01]|nr:NAD-dependent epimerase/dehydratase family protein [Agrobacterium sp. AGB01]
MLKTTLVTGASGFVGSHLVTEMARRNMPFRGLTRGSAPNLVTIPSYSSDMSWHPYLEDVETIVHLAARVHVMRETDVDPIKRFREANVLSTINLAKQAAEAGVQRFVFVSSIKVNGECTPAGKPFRATDPRSPLDPYGVSKAEAEEALIELGAKTGMGITIVRPPLVYGPGVKGNFQTLIKWARKGGPSIFSKVDNKRSFISVDNLCDFLITVLDHPNASNSVFLVSDGEDLSTHELLTRLTTELGRTHKSIPLPPFMLRGLGALVGRKDMIARLTENLEIDMSMTRKFLGWAPPFSVGESLRKLTRP